ncbi:MAG: hypothetical protein JST54_14330 [Deltaproteobacteria bacterium]|nr:hypothetical protein [Deltaproteobacteria bacterium]
MRRAMLTALLLAGCGSGPQAPPPFEGCDQGAAQHVSSLLEANQGRCTVDTDCTTVIVALSCLNEGEQPVLAADQAAVEDQLAQLDKQFCTGSSCSSTTGGGFGETAVCSFGTCQFGEPDSGLQDPPGFGGYFHELGIPQALNLALTPTGTYSATLYGCTTQSAFGGTWFSNGDDGGLLTFEHGLDTTLVGVGDGGVLFTSGPLFFDDGGPDALAPGAVCAVCDGGAPVALVPCDHPFGF